MGAKIWRETTQSNERRWLCPYWSVIAKEAMSLWRWWDCPHRTTKQVAVLAVAVYWVPKAENLQADAVRAQNRSYSRLRTHRRYSCGIMPQRMTISAESDRDQKWMDDFDKLHSVMLARKQLHPERRKATCSFTHKTSRCYVPPTTGRTFLNYTNTSTGNRVSS
jgi:hypothetical protein